MTTPTQDKKRAEWGNGAGATKKLEGSFQQGGFYGNQSKEGIR